MFGAKQFVRVCSVWFLPLVLAGFIFSTSFCLVFTNVTKLKQTARDSGIYSSLMQNVLAESGTAPGASSTISAINTSDPVIQNLIQRAFPANFLSSQGDAILDGTYNWLSGQTDTPNFKVNLAPAKQQLAAELGSYIEQRTAHFPECPSSDLATYNPFSATCLPAGVNGPTLGLVVQQAVASSNNFLPQTTLSADTLMNSNQQPVFDSVKQLPATYQAIVQLPLILGALALFMIIVALLLAHNKRRQLGQLAFLTMASGVFCIAIAFVFAKAWQQFGVTFLGSAINKDQLLLQQASKILTVLNDALLYKSVLLSIIVIVIGCVLFVLGRLTGIAQRPKGPVLQPTRTDNEVPPPINPPPQQLS